MCCQEDKRGLWITDSLISTRGSGRLLIISPKTDLQEKVCLQACLFLDFFSWAKSSPSLFGTSQVDISCLQESESIFDFHALHGLMNLSVDIGIKRETEQEETQEYKDYPSRSITETTTVFSCWAKFMFYVCLLLLFFSTSSLLILLLVCFHHILNSVLEG